MEVKLLVNSFNKGHFEFRLCNAGPEELTEQCFDQNRLKVKQGRKQGDENIFRYVIFSLVSYLFESANHVIYTLSSLGTYNRTSMARTPLEP